MKRYKHPTNEGQTEIRALKRHAKEER